MEDQNVGHQCAEQGCNQRDYFSFFCEGCRNHFCGEHRHVACGQQAAIVKKEVARINCGFGEC